jgi:hypothetical protein
MDVDVTPILKNIWNKSKIFWHKYKIAIIYFGLIFYTWAPVVSTMTASAIAKASGVELDEGSKHPCFIMGHDFGGILYTMYGMAWVALLTLPTGFLATICFSAFLLIKWAFRKPNGVTIKKD